MAVELKAKVCVVVVTGKLKPGQLPLFVENFRPLAAHVAEHEAGTLTYQLSTGYSEDPDRLCIYERYGKLCRSSLLPMHKLHGNPSLPLSTDPVLHENNPYTAFPHSS